MKKITNNQDAPKPKVIVALEYFLFFLCLSVLTLRLTFTESVTVQAASFSPTSASAIYTLIVSWLLIFAFIAWLLISILTGRLYFRSAKIDIPLFIFFIAAIIAAFAASDKRSAISYTAVILAPIITAVLLIQLLDTPKKIALTFAVIVSALAVNTWQAGEQFFISNQMTIDQYKQNPESVLNALNIEEGSFNHMMFEHRLYSKDVRGFFTTSNSAGSFTIIALAAFAFFVPVSLKKTSPPKIVAFLLILAAFIFFLLITHSKGTFAALLAGILIFAGWLKFNKWIKIHKKTIVISSVLIAVAAVALITAFGLKKETLPGGNSMLVRWQYWHASACMFTDHPFTGVGPGNFATFYTHYKPAGGLETVSDPHNFPLSILTQFGPLGLLAFIALVMTPVYLVIKSPSAPELEPKISEKKAAQDKMPLLFTIFIALVMLIIRPCILKIPATDLIEVTIYLYIIMYAIPAAIFIVTFKIILGLNPSTKSATTFARLALGSAIIAFLLHNLIDFAIFEPPVAMTFWTASACLIALIKNESKEYCRPLMLPKIAKLFAIIFLLTFVTASLAFGIIPPANAAVKADLSRKALAQGNWNLSSKFLTQAVTADSLASAPLTLLGRQYLAQSKVNPIKDINLLKNAERYFLAAAEKNPADYKNHEHLSEVYSAMAGDETQDKIQIRNKALASAQQAVELYPHLARLRLTVALLAESLNQTDLAVENYKKSIEIEDAYRRQFRIMYPQRPLFSRLGEENYQLAKQKLLELSPKD